MIIDAPEICGTKGKKPRPNEDNHNLYVYLIRQVIKLKPEKPFHGSGMRSLALLEDDF